MGQSFSKSPASEKNQGNKNNKSDRSMETIRRDQKNYFNSVPKPIMQTIFSFLPFKDLTKVARVSKQWKEMFESNEFWKEKCKMDFNLTSDSEIDNYKNLYKDLSEKNTFIMLL